MRNKFLLCLTILALILNLTGCFETTESSSSNYKLICKIDGVTRTFYAGGFGLNNVDYTYANFYDSEDDDEEYVFIELPHPVTENYAYDTDSDFTFTYRPPVGSSYSTDVAGSTLTLTVTEWGTNHKDPIRGTFSGVLKQYTTANEITITDGTFESILIVN